MLDIHFIRANVDRVKAAIATKAIDLDLDRLLAVDDERRALITQRDSILAERNQLTPDEAKQRGPALKDALASIEPDLADLAVQFDELMLEVPQVPDPTAPVGGESAAVEVKRVGTPRPQSETPLDHLTLGHRLDLINTEQGAQVAGFRGYYLRNEAVLLQFGLLQLALELMRQRGFTLMATPTILREFALVGSGHFPAGRGEIYQLDSAARMMKADSTKELQFLAGTAEPALLAYYAQQTVDRANFPLKVCGISPCYRSEAGSYGKDTKGLYRVHEFWKVEQVVIGPADDAWQTAMGAEMLEIAESLLGELDLPYRVLDIATGDMGPGKVRMYDLETWMPSLRRYGETHSCSLLGDWQARRLGIKYTTADGVKKFAYTLNNTVIASPRILIALLENHQQADGSISIPVPLQRFVGTDRILPKGAV
ncbi:serine--tRNA ligase [Candidatus Berkelbacteria bacterium]|nr:serine--tRNA ligase [Candidatus Berkelbacteria bacterium]